MLTGPDKGRVGHKGWTTMTTNNHSISTAAVFAGCTKRERTRLDQMATPVRVMAGTRLTVEGSGRREFGVLIDGTATVLIGDEPVATLAPGDHYGELSLLAASIDPTARQSATVIADCDQWVAVMSRLEISTVLADLPRSAAVLHSVAHQRRTTNGRRVAAAGN